MLDALNNIQNMASADFEVGDKVFCDRGSDGVVGEIVFILGERAAVAYLYADYELRTAEVCDLDELTLVEPIC